MAFDYAASAATALSLITKFGREVQILRANGRTINKVTGAPSGGSDLTGTIKAAILPASGANINDLDGKYTEELVRGNVRFVIAEAVNVPFAPITGDRIKFDSEEWESIGVTPIAPSGTAVLYKIGIIKR
tara:strand:- start:611 stop:1000 length:390 start_codon:yes stop_codon:yes gene_type:complete